MIVSCFALQVAPLVDHAWEMKPGGTLGPAEWPPAPSELLLGKAWSKQEAGQGAARAQ